MKVMLITVILGSTLLLGGCKESPDMCESCERNSIIREAQLICNGKVIASTKLCQRMNCEIERSIILEQKSFDTPCSGQYEVLVIPR
jgi:hypothetical protein